MIVKDSKNKQCSPASDEHANKQLIEEMVSVNPKTAKKILEKREAIQKLLSGDETAWKREGE